MIHPALFPARVRMWKTFLPYQMRLLKVGLKSFRAHSDSLIEFAPKINLLHGPNGAGKTNVLEAIHYLCLTKSFLTGNDAHVLQRGARFFEVEGNFEGEHRASLVVRLAYVPSEGKRMFRNGAQLERLAEIVGELPLVILAPADHVLTDGGPEHRRRFLNAALSQARPVYLDDLMKYRRALKQRNALLQQLRRGGRLAPRMLDAWGEELVQLGARIIDSRRRFLEQFAGFLAEAYRLLHAVGEEPTMEYVTVADVQDAPDTEAIAEQFRKKLDGLAQREHEQGRTLAGPHRDEVVFRLGDYEVRPYASQGQHRTVGLALRIATFLYLRDRLEETPLLLLDDVFGNLDAQRAEVVLDLLNSDAVGQSFITAARPEALAHLVRFGTSDHAAIELANGMIVGAPRTSPQASSEEPAPESPPVVVADG